MKPVLFLFICIHLCCHSYDLMAQDFELPAKHFSTKQVSTFVLKDGKTLRAKLVDIQRTKGLISGFELKLEQHKNQTLEAKDLRSAQLIPNQLEKAKRLFDFFKTVKSWDNSNQAADQNIVYFEPHVYQNDTLLFQLINPRSDNNIKVFHDPNADIEKETDENGKTIRKTRLSYFIKVNHSDIQVVESKNYKRDFDVIWKNFPTCRTQIEHRNWKNFSMHVLMLGNCKH
ncbi:MAG: hypothetical protein ACPGVE_07865 [Flavobacteriales bacterium]